MPEVKILDNPEQDTQTTPKPPPGYRDEFQRHFDERFGRLVAQWHKDKQPDVGHSEWDRITVPKDQATTVKNMVREAGKLHKHQPRFYPDQRNQDGTVSVKYTVEALPAPKVQENGQQ